MNLEENLYLFHYYTPIFVRIACRAELSYAKVNVSPSKHAHELGLAHIGAIHKENLSSRVSPTCRMNNNKHETTQSPYIRRM